MSITEIKDAVMKLSADELREFIEWIDELQESQWDKQIEEDLQNGRLDHLITEARKEFKEGSVGRFETLHNISILEVLPSTT